LSAVALRPVGRVGKERYESFVKSIPRGRFVVLEGIDGSGTTTQAEKLCAYLESRGRPTLLTREPSSGPIGKLLREILLGRHKTPENRSVDGDTMALLFAADRKDHLEREIRPALERGIDVVCDRYHWSSLAYQAEEANLAWVSSLGREILSPDLTILIDISVQVAERRRRLADRPDERYDADSFLSRVALNYARLAHQSRDNGEPTVVIDGNQEISTVADAIAHAYGTHCGFA